MTLQIVRRRLPLLGAVGAAFLVVGCATGPVEGAVRYRGRRAQVLVVRTGVHQPVTSRERPELGRLGRSGAAQALREAVSVITPEALGQLADDLAAVGFFGLPAEEAKAPPHLPPLTIALALAGRPPRLVRLAALATREQAVAFSESAATILRAAERR